VVIEVFFRERWYQIRDEGIIVHDSDVIVSRTSEISGTFHVNGINYATGIETDGLSTIRAHTVHIEKK
jgi:hypothetical protein